MDDKEGRRHESPPAVADSVVAAESREASLDAVPPIAIVDADVHPVGTVDELRKYLPARFRNTAPYTDMPIRVDTNHLGMRADALPGEGRPAGSDPALLERQLLQEAGVDIAIMLPIYNVFVDPIVDAAWNRGINEWMATTWLGEYNRHRRYRGSIRIPLHDPKTAIEEIERWGDHPDFVQVLALHPYMPAFGHPMYEPIWRAAAERGLPVAVHAANNGPGATLFMTPAGHPSFYFEWKALAFPFAYAAHLSSLVCNGVFDRLPSLRFVMVEGGFGWSQALANHLDRNWLRLRSEGRDLKRLPSEYLHDHVFYTTQPIEEPRDAAALLQIWVLAHAEERLLFASDYPHWDFDDPAHALPRQIDARLRQKIMAGNACRLYRLTPGEATE